MRFKSFKGFTLSKPKERPGDPAEKISLMEEKMSGHTRDLEKLAERIKGLAETPVEDVVAHPHGPLVELSIEPGDSVEDDILEISPLEPVKESQEDVKLVEVKMNKPAEQEKEPEKTAVDTTNSLSGLFTDDDEEENPLANLLKSMPDYTTHEIIEDLNEIKRIILEWQGN